ncbi:hypothetical protein Syun_012634 [Stephania yunnanensis]|uniref:PEP-utilising enzyme C-terminal domain-containing protein n=1 Tax=Stephania yunnanensis TaxID=152371 RepID=A0AAP0K0L3_9MAGN
MGEENMLAVVCKSYAVAGSLECYDEESGRIERERHLHAIANEFGKSIKARFSVIVLERLKNLGVEQIEEIYLPEIMVPLVGTPQARRLEHQVSLIRDVSKILFSEMGTSIGYKIGTMIEIPRAALVADEQRRKFNCNKVFRVDSNNNRIDDHSTETRCGFLSTDSFPSEIVN